MKPSRFFAYLSMLLLILSLVLAFSILGACLLGTVTIPWSDVLTILRHKLLADPSQLPDQSLADILWEIRLPRIFLSILVGAALAVAGVALQGLLRNPLADPYIVGTSAGAALGASLAIVLGLDRLGMVQVSSFVAAILTMWAVYRLAQVKGKVPVETFLLAGVIVGSFLWALVSFVMALFTQDIGKVVFWLMGSLSDRGWPVAVSLLPYLIAGFGILYYFSYPLNLMSLGEEKAQQLGVRVERCKSWILVAASVLTAAAVSVSGLIGFLGLMVPHVARRLLGPDHRILLPASALGGGIFLLWADTAARLLIPPSGIPVGVLTAILGAPFFCYLLRRGGKEGGGRL